MKKKKVSVHYTLYVQEEVLGEALTINAYPDCDDLGGQSGDHCPTEDLFPIEVGIGHKGVTPSLHCVGQCPQTLGTFEVWGVGP